MTCEIDFSTLITVDVLDWGPVVTRNECFHQRTWWESSNLEDGFCAIWGLLCEPVYRKGDCCIVPATFSHSLDPVGLLISTGAKELPLEPKGSLGHLIHL